MGICVQPPCIVTEYCQHGSLYELLRKAAAGEAAQQHLTWQRRLTLLWGTARGMLALHSHDPPIIHRDLRSPNVLITGQWGAKVADFNLSRFADGSSGARSVLSVAADRNPRWLAPEVLTSLEAQDHHPATKESDVFSFGMLMYEVLTKRIPWEGLSTFAVPYKVTQGERPAVPPPQLLPGHDTGGFGGLASYTQLMAQCWEQEPSSRPTFAEVAEGLKHLLRGCTAPRGPAEGNSDGSMHG